MVKVFVFGDRSERKFTEKLCQILNGFGGVLGFYNGNVIETGNTYEFLLCDCERLEKFDLSDAVLIFKTRQKNRWNHKLNVSQRVISIVNEGNQKAFHMLKDSPVPTLTCGMSPKDTLTLSSISDTSAVVSVQREIKDLNNQTIEPCEIKINFENRFSDYELLSACAVLLLADKIKDGRLDFSRKKGI